MNGKYCYVNWQVGPEFYDHVNTVPLLLLQYQCTAYALFDKISVVQEEISLFSILSI